MAASHTLSHSCAIPQISRHGILTLYGYGIRVTMQAGHLQIEDGIGPERRKCRLPRVGHGLKRLVCYDPAGSYKNNTRGSGGILTKEGAARNRFNINQLEIAKFYSFQ